MSIGISQSTLSCFVEKILNFKVDRCIKIRDNAEVIALISSDVSSNWGLFTRPISTYLAITKAITSRSRPPLTIRRETSTVELKTEMSYYVPVLLSSPVLLCCVSESIDIWDIWEHIWYLRAYLRSISEIHIWEPSWSVALRYGRVQRKHIWIESSVSSISSCFG